MDEVLVRYDEKGLFADDGMISQWLDVVQADEDRSRQTRGTGESGMELGLTRALHDGGGKKYAT